MSDLFPMLTLTTLVGSALGTEWNSNEGFEVEQVEVVPFEPMRWCYYKHLRDGRQLEANPELYTLPPPDKAWGTQDLIEVLTGAAEEMAWGLPNASPLAIGPLSYKYGGSIEGFTSHRGGVEAELGLYRVQADGLLSQFGEVPLDELDLEANWLLIRSLLETGQVERILLDREILGALRAHVVSRGYMTREKALQLFPLPSTPGIWDQAGVVHHGPGYRDRLHVRVECPERTPERTTGGTTRRGAAAAPPQGRRSVVGEKYVTLEDVGVTDWDYPIHPRHQVSSGFGLRDSWLHPGTKTFHRGVDIPCAVGEPIYAAADGVVEVSRYSLSAGRFLRIRHQQEGSANQPSVTTRYLHLSRRLVREGDNVRKGDRIGLCGNTGHSTAPHLHFEVGEDGKRLPPMRDRVVRRADCEDSQDR